MTDRKTVREHLRDGDLYLSRIGAVPVAWKQRLLSQFSLQRSLTISLSAPRDWRPMAAVCISLALVFVGITWLGIANMVQLLEQATTQVYATSSGIDVETGIYIAVLVTIATFLWRGRLPSVLSYYF